MILTAGLIASAWVIRGRMYAVSCAIEKWASDVSVPELTSS
jgi:hypothetical protein